MIAGVYGLVILLMYLGQSALLYFPSREIFATPDLIGLTYDPVNFTTADDILLHGWYLPATHPQGTLLFFHGNAGNITHRLDSLNIFSELNLNIFIFDYRGYGQSEGRISEEGSYLDAQAALNYLADVRGVATTNVIFFGRSLGGSIAAKLAADRPPKLLIVESSFTSITDLAGQLYPFVPVRLLSHFRYTTQEYLRKVRCPVLVIHSRDDEIIPVAHGRALYEAANEPKAFLEIRGDHNDGFLTDRSHYKAGLARFLETYR